MRPPVASVNGETPLRGSKAGRMFELANGEFEDKSGFKITKEQVVQNYTDDAKIADSNWNNRHHISPSLFNSKNHKYYKVSHSLETLRAQSLTVNGQSNNERYVSVVLRQGLQEQAADYDQPLETA